MSELRSKLRKYLQYSKSYQKYRAKKFFREELTHVERITDERVCYLKKNKAKQIANMISMINIELNPEKRFQCWIDEGLFTFKSETMTDNIPPNYEMIINNSLENLLRRFEKTESNDVANGAACIIRAVLDYIDRIIVELDRVSEIANVSEKNNLKQVKIRYLKMKNTPAESLEDAFQRILLWQSIFWQSHHRLVGLGRLDKILGDLSDKEDIDSQEMIGLVRDFYDALHKNYAFKSNKISKGDTGQIIIAGGLDEDGKYFCNKLTYAFIEAFMGYSIPDPKILLRVSEKMPEDLLELAVECISTGIGCPLLSNDDVVIPAIREFGYSNTDAFDYVSSACWEPLVYGKSLEKNNLADINYGSVIVELYNDERFESLKSFDEVMTLFYEKTAEEVVKKLNGINTIRWEKDPLMSMFTESCLEIGKDISAGGAKYNDYGLLSAGMANAVNSLLNIKHLVFSEERGIELRQLKQAAQEDYTNKEIKLLLDSEKYYGKDATEVVELTKSIVSFTSDKCEGFRNYLGGKVKFGLSTSNYMEDGRITGATLDGRSSGQALGVHITNPRGIPYTELVQFASKLDYRGNKSNGNVLDYFVSPSILYNDRDKFVLFLKHAIKTGFFQMQMNVVSSEQLIDAKLHPGKYPELIVRVWGFSSYFDDLPEDYKNVLIERALSSEGKCNEVILL